MTNVVALVVQVLRAALPTDQIFAEFPEGADRPILIVDEAGGGPQPSSLMPDRMSRVDVQIRVWGETKESAWDLISSASDALHAAPRSNPVVSAGTLVRVERNAPFYLPDEDWPASGRPGPRYEQTVRIHAHG